MVPKEAVGMQGNITRQAEVNCVRRTHFATKSPWGFVPFDDVPLFPQGGRFVKVSVFGEQRQDDTPSKLETGGLFPHRR